MHDQGKISDKLWKVKIEEMSVHFAILKSLEKNEEISSTLSRIYKKSQEEYRKLIKDEEKHLKLEDALRKMGMGWLVNIIELVKMYGIQGAIILTTLGGAALLVRALFRDFRAIDSAAAEFRKTTGFIRSDSERLEKMARNITFSYAQLGVTAQDVYKSMLAVQSSIGSAQGITEDMVRDMTLLSVQLGVAESTSADFLRVMGQVSEDTMDSQKNVMLYVSALSAAAKTNLNEVMGDVAAAAKSGYQFLSRDPLELAKAAVEAKKMGTNLESATRTSSFLLDFTRSVNAEMEASVLVGKSINLQKARELAYHRDIRGLNAEILNIAKETNFENLDPFQQDAVAKALGKSVDEIEKMVQADREMRNIRNDPALKKEVAEYDRLLNINKQMLGTEADRRREQITALANAEALKTISLAMHAILQRLLQGPFVLIAKTLTGIAWTLNKINYYFGKLIPVGSVILSLLDDILIVLLAIVGARVLGKFVKFFDKFSGGAVGKLFGGFAENIKKIGNAAVSFIKNVGNMIAEIGKGIGRFLINIGRGIGGAIREIFTGIAKGISAMGQPEVFKGILAIGLLGLALIPFAFAMKLMTGLSWKSLAVAAVGLIAFTAAAFGLGALLSTGVGALIFGAGVIGITALGVALIPLGFAAKLAGAGMKALGDGLKETVDSLIMLSQLSFSQTIKSLYELTSAIKAVSGALKTVPKVNISPLSKYANQPIDINKVMPVGSKLVGGKKETSLDDVISAIQSMHDDFKKGVIKADSPALYVNAQKLDTALGRGLKFAGHETG
jgi:hypothetical protein